MNSVSCPEEQTTANPTHLPIPTVCTRDHSARVVLQSLSTDCRDRDECVLRVPALAFQLSTVHIPILMQSLCVDCG